jgi:hypothetical protein
MKWYPGYMSAPHSYDTDRLSLVLSGTWRVNSGADFDPMETVPAPAGAFVRRVAHTPHYDGVKRDANEPAVIALFGIAPVQLTLVDPSKPRLAAGLISRYAGTTGALLLRSASITCRSKFKCACTNSGGVNAIHWSSDTSAK